jgi:hypothetical protein
MRPILASAVCLVLIVSSTEAFAQAHTVIVLSHGTHTISELDPTTGKILHEFGALGARGDAACSAARQACEPHEAAISPDGRTIYATVPVGPFVEILDGATFKEKGRVETEWFKRPAPRPGQPRAGRGTSAWPHGVALNNDVASCMSRAKTRRFPPSWSMTLGRGRCSRRSTRCCKAVTICKSSRALTSCASRTLPTAAWS